MEALRFDLEVPFWCSFGDFSSLNIKLSYPFPPLPTLFGLIQNSLGKPAVHLVEDNKFKEKLIQKDIENFNHLKFSIIIKDSGELIEDYVNIHKGSRENEKFEKDLGDLLKDFIKDSDYENDIKGNLSTLKKVDFYKYLCSNNFHDKKYEIIFKKINSIDSSIITKIKNYWDIETKGLHNFNINKIWLSTQINRQRLINPIFSIYITSDDDGEFSLENIKNSLNNPKRPLYLGESDDVVNILNLSIVNIDESVSSNISSILPNLYSNSQLVKIPYNLKFNNNEDNFLLCSIPNSKLDKPVDCFTYNGENFVFL